MLSTELDGLSEEELLDTLERRIRMVNWFTIGGAKMISEISSCVVPNTAAAFWTAAGLAKRGLLSAPTEIDRDIDDKKTWQTLTLGIKQVNELRYLQGILALIFNLLDTKFSFSFSRN